MKRQLFAIFFCMGTILIVVTSVYINAIIRREFSIYVEETIRKNSQSIVERLIESYDEEGEWDQKFLRMIEEELKSDNFAIAILDQDKYRVWGSTQEELSRKIDELDYPMFYQSPISRWQKRTYIFEDIPIQTQKYEMVGYVRIGYYPFFMLAARDIHFQTAINQSILYSALFGAIGFMFIGAYVTHIFSKPICRMARTSIDLAQGKYKTRYTETSKIKEIENLRYSMNYLAEKLEQQDTLRKKLISDVSHEIRTPLHILQSNLEAMIDGIYPIDEDQMEVLYQEVVRFSSLLNNLDKLKYIETEELSLKKEEVYFNTVVKEVYNAFKIVALERKLQYRLNIRATEQMTVLADVGALKQILMNLLSNAFKFTEHGEITLTSRVDGKKIYIEIQDTGIGIHEDDLPYVFERMYRGDKSREKYEGSGIGLTLVKTLVVNHQGSVAIESVQGKGTKLIVCLPLHKNKRSKTATPQELEIKE
jgi:signal transduction histidine kinase